MYLPPKVSVMLGVFVIRAHCNGTRRLASSSPPSLCPDTRQFTVIRARVLPPANKLDRRAHLLCLCVLFFWTSATAQLWNCKLATNPFPLSCVYFFRKSWTYESLCNSTIFFVFLLVLEIKKYIYIYIWKTWLATNMISHRHVRVCVCVCVFVLVEGIEVDTYMDR